MKKIVFLVCMLSFFPSYGHRGFAFWSARTSDVVPDALNWSDFSDSSSAQSSTLTISGISSSINVRLSFNLSNASVISGYRKNAGAWTNSTPGVLYLDFSVNNGDTLQFRLSGDCATVNYSVLNQSDSNTVLDTFTASVTGGC